MCTRNWKKRHRSALVVEVLLWGAKRLRGVHAQSTVEYAVVVAALLCIVIGLGALFRVLESGLIVEHAVTAASHAVFTIVGGAADVFSY